VSRMQSLVEDLLRYARFQDPVVPEPVGLGAAVERVLVALRGQITERGAAVEVDVAPDAQVLADRSGVDVLLQNLVSNALKFGDPGRPRVVVAARRDGAGWRVDVTDNGAGIEPPDQERIFKAFERLPGSGAAPGTGLGLAICARVVERSGGQLGVDSQPGRGSTFWFVLQPT